MTKNNPGVMFRYRAAGTMIAWALMAASVLACPVCFGVEEGPVTDGLRTAVVVLVGVTLMVLTGFGVFVTRFVRRSGMTSEARPGSGRLETVENGPVPLCR